VLRRCGAKNASALLTHYVEVLTGYIPTDNPRNVAMTHLEFEVFPAFENMSEHLKKLDTDDHLRHRLMHKCFYCYNCYNGTSIYVYKSETILETTLTKLTKRCFRCCDCPLSRDCSILDGHCCQTRRRSQSWSINQNGNILENATTLATQFGLSTP
jgi:hypothetical protein